MHQRSSIFGAPIYRINIAPGAIFHAHDSKRLVIEVGCKTVIYIHIEPHNPQKHHRIFIQSDEAFNFDITLRRDAAEIARNTRNVERLITFEIYFILGALSTLGWGMWLAVTGADVTYLVANKRTQANASKELSQKIISELSEMRTYAPTLTRKILELVTSELITNGQETFIGMPESLINNEQALGQIAGVIFGQWAGNPSAFTVWALFTTVILRGTSIAATNYPSEFIRNAEEKYSSLIDKVQNADPSKPLTMAPAINALIKLANESGVRINEQEARLIIEEVSRNPLRTKRNLSNIGQALNEFKRVSG